MRNNELGMVYAELTVIDGATIDAQGWIIGQSVNPSVRIFGKLLGEEQVIADFSSAKKDIKAIIDDKQTGLDHKLWIFSNSNCKVRDAQPLFTNVISPIVNMTIPSNGVVNIRRVVGSFDDISSVVCSWLGVYVLSEMKKRWPEKYDGIERLDFFDGNHMSVPDVAYDMQERKTVFRYTHGLAKSTSWGCQLIAHGHLSYVVVVGENGMRDTELETKIAALLNNAYIVSNEHIVETTEESETIKIAYRSMSRGDMELTISQKNVATGGIGDVFITQDEPTIENIVKEVVELFREEMLTSRVRSVYISEGSNKGAFYNFF